MRNRNRFVPILVLVPLFTACVESGAEAGAAGASGQVPAGLSCVPGAGVPTEHTANLVVDPRTVQYAPELGVDFANMAATPDGLYCVDQVVGDGDIATPRVPVSVHYTGWLPDGSSFDSSRERDQPFPFVVGTNSVITGWDVGVLGMREGGRRLLVIPPEMAYGPVGAGDGIIPPNSVLVFEVELLEVN